MSPPALRGPELPGPGPPGAATGVRPDPPAQGHPDRRAVTSRPLTRGADDATRGSPAAGTPPPALPPRLAEPGREGATLPTPAAAASAPLSEPGARRGVSLVADASVPRGGGGGGGGSASVHPSICLSVRPSPRGRRLVGVCVTDTAAGQPPARGEPGGWRGDENDNAGAPRLRQPRLRPPQPSPAGATSAASLLLLPPGGISHSVSIS